MSAAAFALLATVAGCGLVGGLGFLAFAAAVQAFRRLYP